MSSIIEVRNTLQAPAMRAEIQKALPPQVNADRFIRVAMTAIQGDPKLAESDRQSLYGACMKAAQDGLLPDGREAALVRFFDRKAGVERVQYMPMMAGILKKIRNSGELVSLSAHVVYERDEFAYELGDSERIYHKPHLDGDRGKPRLVYAIAHVKGDGIYREVMTVGEVEKIRKVSRASDRGPWVDWWDEMAKKSVIRRLAKRLPMSTDLEGVVDDELLHPAAPIPKAETDRPADEPTDQPAPARNSRLQAVVDQAPTETREVEATVSAETTPNDQDPI